MIAPRRFWTDVAVVGLDGGFGVRLDARPLRTPERVEISVPTRALAEAVASEWRAVDGEIRPEQMPFTRAVNVAIDRLAPAPGPVVDLLAAYGATDLLCYRAEAPAGLVARQSAGWDPVLDWAAEVLGAPLVATCGIVPVDQPAASLAVLRAAVAAETAFALAALHDLVTLSGSLVLGLAVRHGAVGVEAAWALSRIDETWQAEQWGRDDEAEAAAARRAADFARAARMIEFLAETGAIDQFA